MSFVTFRKKFARIDLRLNLDGIKEKCYTNNKIDDRSYLDVDEINGLNLYAYCGNNPVMRIDENRNAWWHWVIGALVVVSVAFATAVTAGTFALALGVSSTVVGILTSSVALSEILVGGLNLFVQWSSELEMPDIKGSHYKYRIRGNYRSS